MKNLLKILVPVLGLSFGGLNYANAQSDTIKISKKYSVVEEKINEDDTILEKKEYIIDNLSTYDGNGKIILETEAKYNFNEKDLGKPSDPKEPKNILKRKQIDKLLEYHVINEYEYDTLGRLTTIKKTENYSPGVKEGKKSAVYYTYNEKEANPIKILEDLNNNGKFDAGDKMKVYVSELDRWVSQGE